MRAFASMRALRFLLRARAMIKFVLRAASTLENTTGEQRALRSPLAAIFFLLISHVVFVTFIRVRSDPREFTSNLPYLVFSRG